MEYTIKPEDKMNDVHAKDFVSKMDTKFTLKTKEKDHWTRKDSIKLWGVWT